MITENINNRKATEVRHRAEGTTRDRIAKLSTMTSEEIERIIHDLEVHQIKLEMQNEELLRSNAELDDARKQVEEEKINLQTRLSQAQKMEAIGTLAGGIAHEFNNILASIQGYAEMIREDSPSESSTARDLDQVIKATNRAKDLVKHILAFSRLGVTEKIPLQPALLVKETLKLLRDTMPMNIATEHDVDRECAVIIADPTQIHQMLLNLCTNAFHAMEENGGILSISLTKKALTGKDLVHEQHLRYGNYVIISIRDTGTGIKPEIKAKIFDPYFTTKETGKGTGMGLAIVHGIVKSYGGFITCESKVGEGTVFHINLPSLEEHILPEARV